VVVGFGVSDGVKVDCVRQRWVTVSVGIAVNVAVFDGCIGRRIGWRCRPEQGRFVCANVAGKSLTGANFTALVNRQSIAVIVSAAALGLPPSTAAAVPYERRT